MVFLALIDWLNGERGQFGSTERGFTVLLSMGSGRLYVCIIRRRFLWLGASRCGHRRCVSKCDSLVTARSERTYHTIPARICVRVWYGNEAKGPLSGLGHTSRISH
jgi:hypothetical protein